ncbi:MAG: polyhydroxyalkanoic acid system family protein [Desulfobacterales bacterium]|nr:polyhydroxyalkanoic acid system family protein [Desulfobacterales bacterium]
MPSLKMSLPHNLVPDEAEDRIKGLWDELKEQHGDKISDLNESWSNSTGFFSFRMMGFAVKGTLAVQPAQVVLEGSIPFLALPFKAEIEETILIKAQQILS